MNTINNAIITNEIIGIELAISESGSMDKPGFKIINKVSWIEMCYEEEEEEERRKKEEEQMKKKEKEINMKALSDKRKSLYEIGEYELEEGEIFD